MKENKLNIFAILTSILLFIGCHAANQEIKDHNKPVNIPRTNIWTSYPYDFEKIESEKPPDNVKTLTEYTAHTRDGFLFAATYEFNSDISDNKDELDRFYDKLIAISLSHFKKPTQCLEYTHISVKDSGGGFNEMSRYITGETTIHKPFDTLWGFTAVVFRENVTILYLVLPKEGNGKTFLRNILAGTYYYGPEDKHKYSKTNKQYKFIEINQHNSRIYFDPEEWNPTMVWGDPDKANKASFQMKYSKEISAIITWDNQKIPYTKLIDLANAVAKRISTESSVERYGARIVNYRKLKLFKTYVTRDGKETIVLQGHYSGEKGTISIMTFCSPPEFERSEKSLLEFIDGLVVDPAVLNKQN